MLLALTILSAWLAPAASARPGGERRPVASASNGGPGRVLWNGDFSTGDLSQYAEVKVARTDVAAVVDDPILGSARKALKLTVRNSSRDPTSRSSPKHRAHAQSPAVIEQGDDVYIGLSVLIPRDFPTTHRAGGVGGGRVGRQCALHSIYGPPYAGSSPQQMGFTGSGSGQALRLLRNASYGYDSPWQLPARRGAPGDVTGRWIDVVIHTRMSSSGSVGFREQWVDTGSGYVKQTFANGSTRLMMKTVDRSSNAGGKHSKVQLYFNDDAFPKATVYFADHRIGTSFEVVAPRSHRR